MTDEILEQIKIAMEYVPTEQERIGHRLDFIVRELDEFCGMAVDPETVDLIERERIAIGQIVTRAQLISSFLMARQPQPKTVGFRK